MQQQQSARDAIFHCYTPLSLSFSSSSSLPRTDCFLRDYYDRTTPRRVCVCVWSWGNNITSHEDTRTRLPYSCVNVRGTFSGTGQLRCRCERIVCAYTKRIYSKLTVQHTAVKGALGCLMRRRTERYDRTINYTVLDTPFVSGGKSNVRRTIRTGPFENTARFKLIRTKICENRCAAAAVHS